MTVMATISADSHGQKAEMADDREIGEPFGKPTICSPLVMMLARPRAIDIIASVAMKAGMLSRVTIRPDISPHATEATARPGSRWRTASRRLSAQIAHHHAGEREHGAHREVDAADQNDERHANRHHAEHRDLIHYVEEVAHRQERVRREATRTTQRRTRPIRGPVAPRTKAKRAAAPGFRRRSRRRHRHVPSSRSRGSISPSAYGVIGSPDRAPGRRRAPMPPFARPILGRARGLNACRRGRGAQRLPS